MQESDYSPNEDEINYDDDYFLYDGKVSDKELSSDDDVESLRNDYNPSRDDDNELSYNNDPGDDHKPHNNDEDNEKLCGSPNKDAYDNSYHD